MLCAHHVECTFVTLGWAPKGEPTDKAISFVWRGERMNMDELSGESSELPQWGEFRRKANQLEQTAYTMSPDSVLRVGDVVRIPNRAEGGWVSERLLRLLLVR